MEYFSISEMTRIMQCFGSTVMGVEPRRTPSSTPKDEGEAAHWLAKAAFRGEIDLSQMENQRAPNGFFITSDMIGHVSEYLHEIEPENPNFTFNDVDVDLGFGSGEWAVSGKADHIALCGPTLYVDAFHYGFRIVPAEDNWTMICQAIGFCISRSVQPETIVFTVHQPRGFRPISIPAQISTDYPSLVKRYQEIGEHLSKKQRRCHTGPNCTVCPYSYACSAYNSAGSNAIDIADAPIPQEPQGEELAQLLDDLTRAKTVIDSRIKSLTELATHQINSGKVVPNWLLMPEEGPLKWLPGMTAETVKILSGHDVAKSSMMTPSQAKKQFHIPEAILNNFAAREKTRPKLTRADATKVAKRLFAKGKSQ